VSNIKELRAMLNNQVMRNVIISRTQLIGFIGVIEQLQAEKAELAAELASIDVMACEADGIDPSAPHIGTDRYVRNVLHSLKAQAAATRRYWYRVDGPTRFVPAKFCGAEPREAE